MPGWAGAIDSSWSCRSTPRPQRLDIANERVSRDAAQATDHHRLHRSRADQRVHQCSADAEPIGGLLDGQDDAEKGFAIPQPVPDTVETAYRDLVSAGFTKRLI